VKKFTKTYGRSYRVNFLIDKLTVVAYSDDMKKQKTKKVQGGRRKLPEKEKLVLFAGKIPPAYFKALMAIEQERARQLGKKPTQSRILRECCEALLKLERPDVLRAA
jgi:hypothetical protein